MDAHHLEYPGKPVDVDVDGDVLSVAVDGVDKTGAEQVGLVLVLEGQVGGQVAEIEMLLVHVDMDSVKMWTRGAPSVPSYKFVYRSPGVDAQLLCPSPAEGEDADQDAEKLAHEQLEMLENGQFAQLRERADSPAYHAVLFRGDRFDFKTAKIIAEGADAGDWINWGCAGSAAAKLHLSGHSIAADTRIGTSPASPLESKQAMLYSLTATYCPGEERFTVPGQPLRWVDHRGMLPRDTAVSFLPGSAGTYEGVWSGNGLECLSEPRLLGSTPDIGDKIKSACGDIPSCPADSSAIEAMLLDDAVITFNPD